MFHSEEMGIQAHLPLLLSSSTCTLSGSGTMLQNLNRPNTATSSGWRMCVVCGGNIYKCDPIKASVSCDLCPSERNITSPVLNMSLTAGRNMISTIDGSWRFPSILNPTLRISSSVLEHHAYCLPLIFFSLVHTNGGRNSPIADPQAKIW